MDPGNTILDNLGNNMPEERNIKHAVLGDLYVTTGETSTEVSDEEGDSLFRLPGAAHSDTVILAVATIQNNAFLSGVSCGEDARSRVLLNLLGGLSAE